MLESNYEAFLYTQIYIILCLFLSILRIKTLFIFILSMGEKIHFDKACVLIWES